MTPEERRRGAFVEFDELLSAGYSIENALTLAAQNNELEVGVFRTIAERHFGDLESHCERMTLRADWTLRQAEFAKREEEVRQYAKSRVQNAWDASVPYGGAPDWEHLLHTVIEALETNDEVLRGFARQAFSQQLKQLQQGLYFQQLREENSKKHV